MVTLSHKLGGKLINMKHATFRSLPQAITSMIMIIMCSVSYGAPVEEKLAPKRIVGLQYPRVAHLAGIQGRVRLRVLVSESGSPETINIEDGSPMLAEAAKSALSKWTFTPCSAVQHKCEIEIAVTFTLSGDPCAIDSCSTDFQVDLPDDVRVIAHPARAIVN